MSPIGRPPYVRYQRTPRQQRANDHRSEDWLTERVLEIAARHCWPLVFHLHDARAQDYRSTNGLPDWLFARPGNPARAVFLELKAEDETPTAEQLAWIAVLDMIPGVDAAWLRPSQLQLAADLLGARRAA